MTRKSVIGRFLFFPVFLIFAVMFFICPARAAEPFNERINVVFNDGTIMIYRGSNAGLVQGDKYLVVDEEGDVAATVQLEKVDSIFSIARILTTDKQLREGSKYDFRPADQPVEKKVEEKKPEPKKKTPAKKAEKKEEKPKEPVKVEEKASKSKRRTTRVQQEEADAGADKKEEKADTSKKTTRKKKTETEPSDKKAENKGRRAEKTDTQAERKKTKEDKPVPEREKLSYPGAEPGFPEAATMNGLTGLFFIPTYEVIGESKSAINYKYFKIDGSDSVMGVDVDIDLKMQQFGFRYGVGENAEFSIQETKTSGGRRYLFPDDTLSMTNRTTKSSSISWKYRIGGAPKPGSKRRSGVAFLMSYGKNRTDYAEDMRSIVYGIAGGSDISEKLSIHGLYGKRKFKDRTGTSSESVTGTTNGAGLEYRSNEVTKFYLEYFMEESSEDYETVYTSLGIRYMYRPDTVIDGGLLHYEESWDGGIDVSADDGFQLGIHHMF